MDDLTILSSAIRTIALPARIKILLLLKENKELSVKNIVGAITQPPMAQPTISEHLKVLKNKGLVRAKRIGKEVFYSIDQVQMKELGNELSKLIG